MARDPWRRSPNRVLQAGLALVCIVVVGGVWGFVLLAMALFSAMAF